MGARWLSRLFSSQDSSERLKLVILSKFTFLKKALENFQWQTVARVEQEQTAVLGHVEEDRHLLKERLDILSRYRERAEPLLACPDHRTFLQVPPRHRVPPMPGLCHPRSLLGRAETWSAASLAGTHPQPGSGGVGLQGTAAFGGESLKIWWGEDWIRALQGHGQNLPAQTAQPGSATASQTPPNTASCTAAPLLPAASCSPCVWNQPQLRGDVLGTASSPAAETGRVRRESPLPVLCLRYLCVCPQEFPLLPSPGSLEPLRSVEFDVASVVSPISEVLTSISRLLMVDLPGSVAPEAPDAAGPGNPSARASSHPEPQPGHVTVLGSQLPGCPLPTEGWDGDTHLLFSRWDELGGFPGAPPCWQCRATVAHAHSQAWI